MITKTKNKRSRAKIRVRKKIFGTSERPRMTVFRSLNEIYVQLIDDTISKTIVEASSISKEVKEKFDKEQKKTGKSKLVGKLIAERALAAKIENVVFDRNGYQYHGRVKAVAEAAREAGLKF